MSMSLFRISDDVAAVRCPGGDIEVAVLSAGGELDCFAVPHLASQLDAQVATGRDLLLFDLSEVTFIDSSAIGALLGAGTRLGARGGIFAAVCPAANERVSRIFDIAGVCEVVAVFESRGEAFVAFARARARLPPGSPRRDLHATAPGMGAAKAVALARYARAARLS